MRWLFHLTREEDLVWDPEQRYAPPSLQAEGFIHTSFKSEVRESARRYFPGVSEDALRLLAVDPRRLDVPVEIVETPRGPMPHVHGAIPRSAVHVLRLDALDAHPDHATDAGPT